MDKLNPKQSEAIKKLSTVRLVSKLTQAGIKEETLEPLGREQLMEAWAELVAAGKDVPLAPVTATAAATSSADIEREKLVFERERWEADREERRSAQQQEAARLAWERSRAEQEQEERRRAQEQESARFQAAQEERRLDREAELHRLEAEKEERQSAREEEAARALQQLKLLEEANKLQRDSLARERSRSESTTARLKSYGDALKNAITKMLDNPIELIVFFDSIERMFGELEVPHALRVILLKPYLSERAAMLVNRLTGDVACDYKYVKRYLLEQFRLCPQYFLETFNRVQRAPNETYRAFVSRLSRLLQYYLRSRCVEDFDTVCQLLIADRVKTSLNENVLKHVLNAESTGDSKWLRPDALSDVLDTYYANFQVNDRPRASAIGVTAPRAQTPVNNSPFNNARMGRGQGRGQSNEFGDGKPPVLAVNVSGSTSNAPLSLQSTGNGNKPIRRCYICSSPSHLALNCPSRNKKGATGGRGAPNSLGASSPGGAPR